MHCQGEVLFAEFSKKLPQMMEIHALCLKIYGNIGGKVDVS